jgi:hypothetical protein
MKTQMTVEQLGPHSPLVTETFHTSTFQPTLWEAAEKWATRVIGASTLNFVEETEQTLKVWIDAANRVDSGYFTFSH